MSLQLIKKKYNHYTSIPISSQINNNEQFQLRIVYFVNGIINDNYMDWIMNQLNYVKHYAKIINIVIILEESKRKDFIRYMSKFFPNNQFIYDFHTKNEYEYRGILKVWEIAQTNHQKNDIILYMHSKGVTHHKNYAQNRCDNYNIILKDIQKIQEIFSIFPSIDKVGYSAGGMGWIWYNFWYARGSYIYQVEKPILTARRHYYEDWLGRKVENLNDRIVNHERPLHYYKNTLDSCYGYYVDLERNVPNIGVPNHLQMNFKSIKPNNKDLVKPIIIENSNQVKNEHLQVKNNFIEWYVYKKHVSLFDKYLLYKQDSFLKETMEHSSKNKTKKAVKNGEKIYFHTIKNINHDYYQICVQG